MNLELTAIYCICDDYLKESGIIGWPNEKMKGSEVMTTLITAAQFFAGNIKKARSFLKEHGYIPDMLSHHRLIERIHAIPVRIWEGLLGFIQKYASVWMLTPYFVVDSFPISVCQNLRIMRSRLLQGKEYHGYNANKQCYFYGFKCLLVVRESGLPVQLSIAPGSKHDLAILRQTHLKRLPEKSTLVGDAAFLSEPAQQDLSQKGIHLIADRRRNSKKPLSLDEWKILTGIRKIVETSISGIVSLMPRWIHAVTSQGFILKMIGFVLAFSFTKLGLLSRG